MDTSARIVSYLETHSIATVDQLSLALSFTKAAIHYHIRKMLSAGVIVVSPDPYQDGAGRPARIFMLAKPVPSLLSGILLRVISNHLIRSLKTEIEMEMLCGEIAAQFLLGFTHKGSSAAFLADLTPELEKSGFVLRWQASAEGADIRLFNDYLNALLPDMDLSQGIVNALRAAIQQKIA